MKGMTEIKKFFSPLTILLLVAVIAKIITVNLQKHHKSFYQNYDPEKIALYASADDKQEIEVPPSKAPVNGHTNNNNEFKFKCLALEQASIDLFKDNKIVLKSCFLKRTDLSRAAPIYLSNRSILI